MADDRNDESGANIALESDHIGCKSISPPDWQHISSAPTRYPAFQIPVAVKCTVKARHPCFTACIDAWWIEPVRHGVFRIDQPFLDLPNVIAWPHNSGQGGDAHDIALRRAVENCRRALTGETPLHVIGPDERLM